MLAQYLPAIIMFSITIIVVSLFCIPVTAFPKKNKLVNFYWIGFWVFLAIIASIAGGMNTLLIMGYNSETAANALLAGVNTSFICFVVFAWFRLSAKAFIVGAAAGLKKLKA